MCSEAVRAPVPESHIRGAGPVNSTRPPVPAAVRSPDASVRRLSPLVSVAIRTCESSAAAAGLRTSSTSENPPWSVTVATRSTPGSTSG